MRRTLVLNVVGLSADLIGPHTPNLQRFSSDGAQRTLETILPAVTCSVQATFMTGLMPSEHGIVGNGWYFRDLGEVLLWRQNHRLVHGEKIWEAAKKRDSAFTCAQLFWWYNMHSAADWSVTPRPMYPADGRKIPDIYTQPMDLRDELNAKLGEFPLFNFWGPRTDISSSRWIASCTEHIWNTRSPSLTLCYLPHLDYNLQRLGPGHAELANDLAEIDAVCGDLIAMAERDGARVVVLSEYGMTEVTDAIHINRELRKAGFIQVREELGRDVLDPAGCRAFAVSDHQLAHVYVPDTEDIDAVRRLLENLDGVERVMGLEEKRDAGLDHANSGELVAVSHADRWFSYYYWLDDARAPDFARTVDIHRKPGYDPVELFVDPTIKLPMLKVASILARKKLGFRTLLDVIGLDTTLVRGAHGRLTDRPEAGPVFLTNTPELLPPERSSVRATEVKDLVLGHLFAD